MLVHTWLSAERELHGLNETQARTLLNQSLGTKYTHGNVNHWKNGRMPYKDVRLYMLNRCLQWYFQTEFPKLDIRSASDIERAVFQLL